MKFQHIAINASRVRDGGGVSHLKGILNHFSPKKHEIKKIHLWSNETLLKEIKEASWLIKHPVNHEKRSIIFELFWEKYLLKKEIEKNNCAVLLNVDAGSLCRFKPFVTISRDMLSYEGGEIDRYGFGFPRLRLILLKFIQNQSFQSASSVVFLTDYASQIIQQSCGKLKDFSIIPHGVSDAFRKSKRNKSQFLKGSEIKCLYVSNVAPYKHQWIVVEAISKLVTKGYNIKLVLTGGGIADYASVAQKKLDDAINRFDLDNKIIEQLGYVDQEKLPNLILEADIFIFASSCENMPNTLIEGMSVGLPIACSNRGPMPEVLKDGGVYFDPEDCNSISIAIERLITDNILRIETAKVANNLSRKYSWSRCSYETFRHLVQVLRKNQIEEKIR